MESAKGCQLKKGKKKQVKDETDRIKHAEKKRRRLEKALATSAAIRSELEKKKQQKMKEEQERLDEEGAAMAEAVALHVLLGEDSNDPRIVLREDQINSLGDWHHAANVGLFLDGNTTLSRESMKRGSVENVGWVPTAYRNGFEWNHFGALDPPSENFHIPHVEDGAWFHDDILVGLMAAQAVRSLRLGEDAQVDIPVFFNTY